MISIVNSIFRVQAYYALIAPYVLPSEHFLNWIHNCAFDNESCEYFHHYFKTILSLLGDSLILIILRAINLIVFLSLCNKISTLISRHLGKDVGKCFIILTSLQFSSCFNGTRFNKAMQDYFLGSLFCISLLIEHSLMPLVIILAFLVSNTFQHGHDSNKFSLFQGVSPIFIISSILSFSNQIKLETRISNKWLFIPVTLLLLPHFNKSLFIVPYLTFLSAWGLSKM